MADHHLHIEDELVLDFWVELLMKLTSPICVITGIPSSRLCRNSFNMITVVIFGQFIQISHLVTKFTENNGFQPCIRSALVTTEQIEEPTSTKSFDITTELVVDEYSSLLHDSPVVPLHMIRPVPLSQ